MSPANAFERDGVILWRDTLNKIELRQVIGEYESTDPDLKEPPKHKPMVVFWTHIVFLVDRGIRMDFLLHISCALREWLIVR